MTEALNRQEFSSQRTGDRLRILYVSYSYWPPDFGGEVLLSIERLQALAQRGHEVVALTSGKPGFPKYEVRDGIQVFRSPIINTSKPGRALRRLVYFVWVLWNLLRRQYDAVHIGSLPGLTWRMSTVFGWIFARVAAAKKARSIYVHSLAYSEQEPLRLSGSIGAWTRQFYNAVLCHISISPAIHDAAAEAFPHLETMFVPCGIRDDIFVPLTAAERAAIRERLSLKPDDVVFAFLGTVGLRKGFDLLAEAFAHLSAEHPNWKLLVLGPYRRQDSQNVDEAEVRDVTALLNGSPNVIYMGRVDDRAELAELIGSSDVFAFPSRREGMGIAPIEAMAAGVPPIIALLPGITDQANIDGETGLYIAPNSAAELEAAMRTLGEDAALRQRMSIKATERVRQAFGWQQHIDQWERIYQPSSQHQTRG